VRFRGGRLSRWIHETFPETGCALAIEFKKFFMDEWTGEVDRTLHGAILEALRSTTPGVLEELAKAGRSS
jgi:N-formylglutamate deformylase